MGLFVDQESGSGSGIFPDPDLDPGEPKRPDPDPRHWFEVHNSIAAAKHTFSCVK